MYHSNREDPSNHRCVLYDSRSPGHFSAAAVISPSEKRQAENLTPLHHQSFHFTNDAAAQLATRSMEPCYTRPNDIVRAQQLSINLPWPAGAESAAKPHDHRNNKEHGIARICRGECTPAPYYDSANLQGSSRLRQSTLLPLHSKTQAGVRIQQRMSRRLLHP